MPVEIRELIIRAVATDTANCADDDLSNEDKEGGRDQEAVVEACVKEVLRILERKVQR